jgi:hypoxanthine-guanine phosphoribosyltransferase
MRRIKSLKRCHTGKHEYDVSIQLGCLNGCFAFASLLSRSLSFPTLLGILRLGPAY